MTGMYWIKLYHEILDDPKMGSLPDRLWRRVIELFLCAGRLGESGELPETMQLAWVLRVPTDELELDLKQIAMTGIIQRRGAGWFVTKFAKRQGPVPTTERVKNFRERQKRSQYYEDETQLKRSVTQINRLTDYTDKAADAARQWSPGQAYFIDAFGAKQFKTKVQAQTVYELEERYGLEKLEQGTKWTANLGMNIGKAITALETALPKWGEPKVPNKNGKNTEPAGFAGIRSFLEKDDGN